jgi:hypothetical protein
MHGLHMHPKIVGHIHGALTMGTLIHRPPLVNCVHMPDHRRTCSRGERTQLAGMALDLVMHGPNMLGNPVLIFSPIVALITLDWPVSYMHLFVMRF